MPKGFLKIILVNQTEITIYVEVFGGLLVDDSQFTLCVHIFLERPETRSLEIHTLEPGRPFTTALAEQGHLFIAANAAPLTIKMVQMDEDSIVVGIHSIDAQQGNN